MIDIINTIVGVGVIVLNLIPFILKKPKYLFLTIIVSFIILSLLFFFKNL
ncbi:hypothetical protein HY498_05660 [Candidatus Woesearchaeota archaeon]|nr:hypothetical protein [Candidatus Woesearchaeota archaeon]